MWRSLFWVGIWGWALISMWSGTTNRFLHDSQKRLSNEIQSEREFRENFLSLQKTFRSYLKLYSFSREIPWESYESFFQDAQSILSSVRLQHKAWRKIQIHLPLGDPLRSGSQRDYLSSFLFLSPFGKRRDPLLKEWGFHTGVDFEARKGDPVYSTGDGVLLASMDDPAYGKNIVVQHSYGFRSVYAHLSKIRRDIEIGTSISKGQILGYVGKTGRTTGDHLHYEIQNQGVFLNPGMYLEWGKSLL